MLLILPMWMNFLLRTYSWMSILENNGILNNWIASLREMIPPFDAWLTSRGIRRRIIFLYNENAVILGMVYNYLSFMIMPIYTVIEKIDKSMLEAAADLGASPAKSFLRVTLPYSLPGVLEGITMVFVPAVTTFVISQLMGGGKVPLIGDIIQNQFGKSSDWHFGATLSLLVMVVVLAFMGALNNIDKEDEQTKEVRIF
jgi:spermidine/putrescine transport system permease protein